MVHISGHRVTKWKAIKGIFGRSFRTATSTATNTATTGTATSSLLPAQLQKRQAIDESLAKVGADQEIGGHTKAPTNALTNIHRQIKSEKNG